MEQPKYRVTIESLQDVKYLDRGVFNKTIIKKEYRTVYEQSVEILDIPEIVRIVEQS